MSCSPFDLRDYVLKELADPEVRLLETHLKSCPACREELDRLRLTEAALLSLPDEEIPKRIGFVSDPVFEPSALAHWWRSWWESPARLGFASAAMLSIAIIVSAFMRPAPQPAPQVQRVDMAAMEARLDQRVEAAVRQAVERTEARDGQNTLRLLSTAETRHRLELRAIQMSVEENLDVIQRRQQKLLYMAAANGEVR
jgi:hypothetical protein